MARKKDPGNIVLQRVSLENIDRIIALDKMKVGDSFNDVLTRVLNKFEDVKKQNDVNKIQKINK